MPYIQVIEYTTSKWDQIEALVQQYEKDTEGRRTSDATRVCLDRDRANHYVAVVEFPSYEAAMENNNLEETATLAEAIMPLCDEPPIFHNLDVIRVMG